MVDNAVKILQNPPVNEQDKDILSNTLQAINREVFYLELIKGETLSLDSLSMGVLQPLLRLAPTTTGQANYTEQAARDAQQGLRAVAGAIAVETQNDFERRFDDSFLPLVKNAESNPNDLQMLRNDFQIFFGFAPNKISDAQLLKISKHTYQVSRSARALLAPILILS